MSINIDDFIDIVKHNHWIRGRGEDLDPVEIRVSYSQKGYKLYVDFKKLNISFKMNSHKKTFQECVNLFIDKLKEYESDECGKSRIIKRSQEEPFYKMHYYNKDLAKASVSLKECKRIIKELSGYRKELYVLLLKETFKSGYYDLLGAYNNRDKAWDSKVAYEDYYKSIPNIRFQVDMVGCGADELEDCYKKIKLNKELDKDFGYLQPRKEDLDEK